MTTTIAHTTGTPALPLDASLTFSSCDIRACGTTGTRAADIRSAFESIMSDAGKNVLSQAAAYGATIAGACALMSGGVPPTIVGAAAATGAVASMFGGPSRAGRNV